jgi:hypothetical protein
MMRLSAVTLRLPQTVRSQTPWPRARDHNAALSAITN